MELPGSSAALPTRPPGRAWPGDDVASSTSAASRAVRTVKPALVRIDPSPDMLLSLPDERSPGPLVATIVRAPAPRVISTVRLSDRHPPGDDASVDFARS